jgi:hypothetical protein
VLVARDKHILQSIVLYSVFCLLCSNMHDIYLEGVFSTLLCQKARRVWPWACCTMTYVVSCCFYDDMSTSSLGGPSASPTCYALYALYMTHEALLHRVTAGCGVHVAPT